MFVSVFMCVFLIFFAVVIEAIIVGGALSLVPV